MPVTQEETPQSGGDASDVEEVVRQGESDTADIRSDGRKRNGEIVDRFYIRPSRALMHTRY